MSVTSNQQPHSQNPFSSIRNYQTQQQAIFLAILNQYYDIFIEFPKKKSIVSLPFLKIIKLQNEKEIVNFHDCITSIVKRLYEEDISAGVTDKTATRRNEVNRITECIKYLTELAAQRGFVSHTCDIGKKRIRENVQKISFDGVELDTNDIIEKGSKISNVLVKERMDKPNQNGMYCLLKQDLEIMSLLFC